MKKLLVLIAFLGVFKLHAAPSNPPAIFENYPSAANISIVANPPDCNLPAPNNFVVTATTSSSISLQWDAVAGAVDYRIAASAAVAPPPPPPIFTSPTSCTFVNLEQGTDYTFTIAAGCGDNNYSRNSSETSGSTDFVIEIVYNGYNGTYGSPQHVFSGAQPSTCDIQLGQCYVGELRENGNLKNKFTFSPTLQNSKKIGFSWKWACRQATVN